MGIHDVFMADNNIPITLSLRRSSSNAMGNMLLYMKTILGFDFDRVNKTIWLKEAKQAHLLTVLHGWICSSKTGMNGVPFKEFESVVAKIRHAFMVIPAGRGLLTPCNQILQTKPSLVYLQCNPMLRAVMMGFQTLLWESSDSPTRCRELIGGWLDYIGVCDALSHGIGGVIVGENKACVPSVFCWEWPQQVIDRFHDGHISNSNLEMPGLLLLWLVMESVCRNLREKRVTLFSNNSPTVGWVQCLTTHGSMVSAHLIRALALRLKLNRTCPITPLHIAGEENSMTDIPSRSFGNKPKSHCRSNTDLLTLFNNLFSIPSQNSWTISKFPSSSSLRLLSLLCNSL